MVNMHYERVSFTFKKPLSLVKLYQEKEHNQLGLLLERNSNLTAVGGKRRELLRAEI